MHKPLLPLLSGIGYFVTSLVHGASDAGEGNAWRFFTGAQTGKAAGLLVIAAFAAMMAREYSARLQAEPNLLSQC